MRAVFLSDVHAAGRSCPRQSAAIALLTRIRCDLLVLAGDVFQRWAEDGRRPHPEVAPLCEAILRAAPRLAFVPGNHDHAASGWFARVAGAQVGPSLLLELDGLRVRVSHGDEADTSRGYRALRALLRSRAADRLRDTLGAGAAWRLQAALDHAPAGAPDPALVAAQRALAARVLASGDADVVVHGHTHAPGREALPGGVWLNLGDGVRHRTLGLVEDGRVALLGWEAALG
jgi:UDP-2,3-diacylglucosamine hydrolase